MCPNVLSFQSSIFVSPMTYFFQNEILTMSVKHSFRIKAYTNLRGTIFKPFYIVSLRLIIHYVNNLKIT